MHLWVTYTFRAGPSSPHPRQGYDAAATATTTQGRGCPWAAPVGTHMKFNRAFSVCVAAALYACHSVPVAPPKHAPLLRIEEPKTGPCQLVSVTSDGQEGPLGSLPCHTDALVFAPDFSRAWTDGQLLALASGAVTVPSSLPTRMPAVSDERTFSEDGLPMVFQSWGVGEPEMAEGESWRIVQTEAWVWSGGSWESRGQHASGPDAPRSPLETEAWLEATRHRSLYVGRFGGGADDIDVPLSVDAGTLSTIAGRASDTVDWRGFGSPTLAAAYEPMGEGECQVALLVDNGQGFVPVPLPAFRGCLSFARLGDSLLVGGVNTWNLVHLPTNEVIRTGTGFVSFDPRPSSANTAL